MQGEEFDRSEPEEQLQ